MTQASFGGYKGHQEEEEEQELDQHNLIQVFDEPI